MRLRRGASSISSVCNSRRGGSFVTACSHRVHARRPRRVTIMDGALDSLSVAYSQVVVALPAGQHVSGSAARQSYRRFVTAGSRACGQKETAAWVEGGGTPRPPLELGGSRPDGGGGRHRPAASSRDDAEFVPAEGVHSFSDLTITISPLSFIVEIEVSFLKWFNKVTRLGTTCDLWESSGRPDRGPSALYRLAAR